MKGLKHFLSTILIFVMCFSCCFSAFSEATDGEQKAQEIFEGLAKSYNSALSYLESLQKLMDKNNDKQFPALEDPNALWFYNYLDILDNTIVFSRLFSYAKEIRPEVEDPNTNFIYDTLIVPVYEKYNKYGQTDDGVISTLITINDLIWEDEKAQEHLEEQMQALRQFKKDFPDYELLSDLQNMYKVTFSIVDYSYNERIGTTEYSFGNKIREYQDIKRDLQGSFDLYFDWPDSIYPGSQETYRDFFVTYWKEIGPQKEAEKAAKEKALRQEEEAKKRDLLINSLHGEVKLGMGKGEVIQAETDAGNVLFESGDKVATPDKAEEKGWLYYYGEVAGGNPQSWVTYAFDDQNELTRIMYFIKTISSTEGRKLFEQIEKTLKKEYGEPIASAALKTRLDIDGLVSTLSKNHKTDADYSQWIINQEDGTLVLIEHAYKPFSTNDVFNEIDYTALDENSKEFSMVAY